MSEPSFTSSRTGSPRACATRQPRVSCAREGGLVLAQGIDGDHLGHIGPTVTTAGDENLPATALGKDGVHGIGVHGVVGHQHPPVVGRRAMLAPRARWHRGGPGRPLAAPALGPAPQGRRAAWSLPRPAPDHAARRNPEDAHRRVPRSGASCRRRRARGGPGSRRWTPARGRRRGSGAGCGDPRSRCGAHGGRSMPGATSGAPPSHHLPVDVAGLERG